VHSKHVDPQLASDLTPVKMFCNAKHNARIFASMVMASSTLVVVPPPADGDGLCKVKNMLAVCTAPVKQHDVQAGDSP
jgi:hypothetical protein